MSRHPDLAALARDMNGRSTLRGSFLLLVILFCLIAAGIWATVTELDDVVRADGRVVPSGDVQVVEATEPGVLQLVHVQEGQIVEMGTLLMEFDPTQADSDLDRERQRIYGLKARMQRLQAEISGVELDFDPNLIRDASDVVQSETALYQGRQAELADEITILERQREQRQRELEEGAVDKLTAVETLKALSDERALIEPLVQRRMEPATTLLALRRSEAEWKGRKKRAEAAANRLQTALSEIDDRINAARSRFRSAALTDLALATTDLATLEPTLPALETRSARAQVRAPVRGIINKIHKTTLGGLARSGEELIEVVPLDDNLLVEAYLKPDDIAFLHAGQKVKVKVTAYDFARYGALNGEIIRIGADTVTRSERQDDEVFVVKIRTSGSLLDADGAAVEIIPGMIAQVDILAGRKSVLDYLVQPVLKIKTQALRD